MKSHQFIGALVLVVALVSNVLAGAADCYTAVVNPIGGYVGQLRGDCITLSLPYPASSNTPLCLSINSLIPYHPKFGVPALVKRTLDVNSSYVYSTSNMYIGISNSPTSSYTYICANVGDLEYTFCPISLVASYNYATTTAPTCSKQNVTAVNTLSASYNPGSYGSSMTVTQNFGNSEQVIAGQYFATNLKVTVGFFFNPGYGGYGVHSLVCNVFCKIYTGTTGAQLIGVTQAATVNGVATFSNLTITMAGTYTLVFSSPLLADVTSGTITVLNAPAVSLNYTVQPLATTNQSQFVNPITVVALDQYSNVDLNFIGAVHLGLSWNSSATNITNGSVTTVTAIAGVATFLNFALDGPVNGIILRANSTGLKSVFSDMFNVVHLLNQAYQLSVLVQPQNGYPTVQITDYVGQQLSAPIDQVATISLGNARGAYFDGSNTVMTSSGVGEFDGLVISQPNLQYYWAFSAVGLHGSQTYVFNVDGVTQISAPVPQSVYTGVPFSLSASLSIITDQFNVQFQDGIAVYLKPDMSGTRSTVLSSPNGLYFAVNQYTMTFNQLVFSQAAYQLTLVLVTDKGISAEIGPFDVTNPPPPPPPPPPAVTTSTTTTITYLSPTTSPPTTTRKSTSVTKTNAKTTADDEPTITPYVQSAQQAVEITQSDGIIVAAVIGIAVLAVVGYRFVYKSIAARKGMTKVSDE